MYCTIDHSVAEEPDPSGLWAHYSSWSVGAESRSRQWQHIITIGIRTATDSDEIQYYSYTIFRTLKAKGRRNYIKWTENIREKNPLLYFSSGAIAYSVGAVIVNYGSGSP